jgi:hypothetical protein
MPPGRTAPAYQPYPPEMYGSGSQPVPPLQTVTIAPYGPAYPDQYPATPPPPPYYDSTQDTQSYQAQPAPLYGTGPVMANDPQVYQAPPTYLQQGGPVMANDPQVYQAPPTSLQPAPTHPAILAYTRAFPFGPPSALGPAMGNDPQAWQDAGPARQIFVKPFGPNMANDPQAWQPKPDPYAPPVIGAQLLPPAPIGSPDTPGVSQFYGGPGGQSGVAPDNRLIEVLGPGGAQGGRFIPDAPPISPTLDWLGGMLGRYDTPPPADGRDVLRAMPLASPHAPLQGSQPPPPTPFEDGSWGYPAVNPNWPPRRTVTSRTGVDYDDPRAQLLAQMEEGRRRRQPTRRERLTGMYGSGR